MLNALGRLFGKGSVDWRSDIERGRRFEAEGNLGAARARYEAAVSLAPDELEPLIHAARICRSLGDFSSACGHYQSALRRSPGDTTVHLDFCSALVAGGSRDTALGELNALLRAAGNAIDEQTACRAAQLMLECGDAEAAGRTLEHVPEPSVEALRLRGIALIAQRRHVDAVKLLEPVYRAHPGAAVAFLIGAAHQNVDQVAAAEPWLERALEHDPHHADALYAFGLIRSRQRRFDEATEYLRRLVDEKPEHGEAHNQLGLALHRLGRHEEAIDHLNLAAHFAPALWQPLFNRALAEHALERYDDAIGSLNDALAIEPDSADCHAALGMSLQALDRYEEASGHYERALSIDPDRMDVLNNAGMAYVDAGSFARAIPLLERALELNPRFASAWSNLGRAYLDAGDTARALECFESALSVDPAFDLARWNSACARLHAGDFDRGWTDYEKRWQCASARSVPFRLPEWRGEPLNGRRLFVYAEQGLGDQIMFASCLPEVSVLAGGIELECSPKLGTLFRRAFPFATVHANDTTNSASAEDLALRVRADAQVAIGSLPLHFRRERSQFPRKPYLRADLASVARWKQRLDALGLKPKIGLSWQGGRIESRRAIRSLPLEALVPLMRELDGHYISLQYTPCEHDVAAVRARHGLTVHHWQDAIDDYDQTAALVCALDLVISVCTSVVHLAGALGRPALVLVPFMAEWRYGLRGDTMPWYPHVRLLRQREPGDWEGVLSRVPDEARNMLAHPVPSDVST